MLNWSEALSVGVGALDEDHKLLLTVSAAVRRALADRERELALAGGDVLAETCRAHFNREEEMLKACGFPGLENHRVGHGVFLETLDLLRSDIERGLWLPAQARLGEIIHMMGHRLLLDDRAYSRWLADKGLVPKYDELAFTGWGEGAE